MSQHEAAQIAVHGSVARCLLVRRALSALACDSQPHALLRKRCPAENRRPSQQPATSATTPPRKTLMPQTKSRCSLLPSLVGVAQSTKRGDRLQCRHWRTCMMLHGGCSPVPAFSHLAPGLAAGRPQEAFICARAQGASGHLSTCCRLRSSRLAACGCCSWRHCPGCRRWVLHAPQAASMKPASSALR